MSRKMNIFIDTNVFLSFYNLTSEDLEELRKLSVLLNKGEVVLFLPGQIRDEYKRNRESKIASALKTFKGQNLKLQYPALCKDYTEYLNLRAFQKDFEKEHASLLMKVSDDTNNNTLKADKVIEELFGKGKQIEISEDILNRAQKRVSMGNPPGKKGSLGDAINWEALLSKVPEGEDLYLIADDGDFFSALDPNKPKEFVIGEWQQRKSSKVNFYRRISAFFKEHYPEIKLAIELEKEVAVQKLVTSGNFFNTHCVVAKLNKFENFTDSQVNQIVVAALTNDQVNMIINDPDVFEFLSNFVNQYRNKIDPEELDQLNLMMEAPAPEQEEQDDFPF